MIIKHEVAYNIIITVLTISKHYIEQKGPTSTLKTLPANPKDAIM